MSMNLTVYVGPYLRVVNCPDGVVDRFESVVCDGRGELFTGDPDGVTYLVPNCKLPGTSRQMTFSRDSDMPVVPIGETERDFERGAFVASAAEFITAAKAAGATVESLWGVVCDYS